jgi:NAD(P)-dependent dehydrogenase (short-subunit alcohol dehydrogenase family)
MTNRPVAVVTGATGSVGGSVAQWLIERDWHVLAVVRGTAHNTLRPSHNGIGRLDVVVVDFTTHTADEVLASIDEELGRFASSPRLLVNAAGVVRPNGLLDSVRQGEWAAWEEALLVNLTVPLRLSAAFASRMVTQQDPSWIVNVLSAQALEPPHPVLAAYGLTKAALWHGTQILAAELRRLGTEHVGISAIHPGDVPSRMWLEIGNMLEQQEQPAGDLSAWHETVGSGGDSPEEAATLIGQIIGAPPMSTNGQFLACGSAVLHHDERLRRLDGRS